MYRVPKPAAFVCCGAKNIPAETAEKKPVGMYHNSSAAEAGLQQLVYNYLGPYIGGLLLYFLSYGIG